MADAKIRKLRTPLTEAASKPKRQIVTKMAAFGRMLRRKYGPLRDSTSGIRTNRMLGG